MKTLTRLALALGVSSLVSMPLVAGTPTVSESSTFEQTSGEDLYNSICQGCHMEGGKGADSGAGYYPALANNPKLAAPGYPIYVLTNGLGGMPSFKRYLSDEQIMEVVNYVRTNFGNDYQQKATLEDVKMMTNR
ncbi:c-type cytochrome [Marinobacter sp. X15-166B]|uniref:c-type cytochrome n=1 Tax=Marinobacter sp. X15-166B TaxID=1897620 RepID=UPI00085BF258|nr:cytochrome c [Marinobacter sp. X15-166B]OEY67300.1 cytochrome C oxidase Cbb3 [Marinobacter sp. X15-166B]